MITLPFRALKKLIPVTNMAAVSASGLSPLHSAAEGGHPQCLELLLSSGFNVNFLLERRIYHSYNDHRLTALYFAVSNSDIVCSRILLQGNDLECLSIITDDEIMLRILLNHGYFSLELYCFDDFVFFASGVQFCEFVDPQWMHHLAAPAVCVLLEYVGQVHLCHKLRKVLAAQPEWSDICSILGKAFCFISLPIISHLPLCRLLHLVRAGICNLFGMPVIACATLHEGHCGICNIHQLMTADETTGLTSI
uniref:Uncharacterized protein n=1 Tax=Eptatretus burgeri TaxID=7764 RepID=A0A8C4NC62_EPTBU